MIRAMMLTAALLLPAVAQAQTQETTTYNYDALGRLVMSLTKGGVNNGTQTDIKLDAAGNRSTYKVAGAPTRSAASGRVIVVPLNGYTVIPLPNSVF